MEKLKRVKFLESVQVGPREELSITETTKDVEVFRDGGTVVVLTKGGGKTVVPLTNVRWFVACDEQPKPKVSKNA